MTERRVRPPAWVGRLLRFSAGHPGYPFVVAAIALVSTATFAFPFAVVLIPAVFLAPRRWLVLGLACGVASGLGGTVLFEVFRFLGQEVVLARYPNLVDSDSWRLAADWLDAYGLLALAFIAGSPIPQTPALAFYALADPPTIGIFLAIGAGKTLKYLFLSWLAARFPDRFAHYR